MAAFGPRSMLTQEQAVEIRVLARQGMGIREIARQMGCSRNTVKRYLRDGVVPAAAKKAKAKPKAKPKARTVKAAAVKAKSAKGRKR